MKHVLALPPPVDPQAVGALTAQLNLPAQIAAILVGRGYAEPDAARAFLRPRLADLRDPWSMAGMREAVERLSRAIESNQTILVHGDYDVDGVCGSALLVRALRELGASVEAFVPNRLRDGYDFGPAGLAAALELGSRCVLTCDCGTMAHETIAAARREGIDVVVTDHHTAPAELPPAVAVLNPNRPDCGYPEKVLCGAGVAFKLLQALFERQGRTVEDLYKYLDLVAIPTVADLVPLTGENRILVRTGLKVLRRTPNPGLQALLQVAGLAGGRIDAGQIAFVIGPRINAVGRMGDAMRGVNLLLTDDATTARALAEEVDAANRYRQGVERETFQRVKERLEESYDPGIDRAIVMASDDWHPGVIGIVASRVVEEVYRPTVLIALDGASGRGSGRSIPGFHLYDALKACEDYLEQFGGHRYAAGLQIHREQIAPFREALNAYAADRLAPEDLNPKLFVDIELPIGDVSSELFRLLVHFGPFGRGNPTPVILSRNVGLLAEPKVVGEDHLRLRLDSGDGVTREAIAYGLAHEAKWLNESSRIDLAFHLGVRSWQGTEYVQARVVDVRPSEAAWAVSES